MMSRLIALAAGLVVLAGCSSGESQPPVQPGAPAGGAVLPADMPPLKCADFENPPTPKPAEKITGRRCLTTDGKTRWIAAFYPCVNDRIWPVLVDQQPTSAPPEPTDPLYKRQCRGQ